MSQLPPPVDHAEGLSSVPLLLLQIYSFVFVFPKFQNARSACIISHKLSEESKKGYSEIQCYLNEIVSL